MTKSRVDDLALFGGGLAFDAPVPVGQMNFPSWERYVEAMSGIFEREYYTNHGPLAVELEAKLEAFLGVANVICVNNATVGLMMAVKALGLDGPIVMPAFTFPATAQAALWSGATPVYCDVDPGSCQVTAESVEAACGENTRAILAVNLWGGACDVAGLESLGARLGIEVIFDSAQAFGCELDGKPLGGRGHLEVFSFHATKILNAAEGGCVCTDDDELAARLRNIRSSYGAGPAVEVPITANGRFSEGQAALALMSLDEFPANRRRNQDLHRLYTDGLSGLGGLAVLPPQRVEVSNYQYVACTVDSDGFGVTRDVLLEVLLAENVIARRYFYPGLHRVPILSDHRHRELPGTDQACASVIQLPIGALVDPAQVSQIVELVRFVHDSAPGIAERWTAETFRHPGAGHPGAI